MAQIISGSIDLSKIDKSKIVDKDKNGQKFNNGAMYLQVTIMVNDQPDKYGNDVSISIGQTKEEREAKTPKVFLGNAKTVWKGQGKGGTANAKSDTSNDLVSDAKNDAVNDDFSTLPF
jgi:hypothetical protein